MKRVLVVDDHDLFREGIISMLQAAGFDVVGEAENGEIAIEKSVQLRPDFILMDISMPGTDGIDALRIIRGKLPDAKIVMLTASEDDDDLLNAIQNGASGYLRKNQSSRGFIESLRGLEKGEVAISKETTARLMSRLTNKTATGAAPKNRKNIILTPKEMELIPHLCEGLTNKEISLSMGISENTVKYHIKNIMSKLRTSSRAEIAVYAVKNGLYSREN